MINVAAPLLAELQNLYIWRAYLILFSKKMAGKKLGKSVLGRRYAMALLDLAEEKNQISSVESDFTNIKEILSTVPQFAKILHSPVVSKSDLSKALSAILKKSKISDLTIKFCETLSENRRLGLFPEIAEAFAKLAAESRDEMAVTVTSANPLKEKELADIKAVLNKVTGKKINLSGVVNKDILGGFIIKAGFKMFDASIGGKLEKLKLHLKG